VSLGRRSYKYLTAIHIVGSLIQTPGLVSLMSFLAAASFSILVLGLIRFLSAVVSINTNLLKSKKKTFRRLIVTRRYCAAERKQEREMYTI